MKKRVAIILFLFCTSVRAQSLELISVDNNTVCVGDSITVHYYINSEPKTFMLHLDMTTPTLNQVWQYDSLFWASQKYSVVVGRKLYSTKIRISPDHKCPSVGTLFSDPYPISFQIYIECCGVGIKENEPNTEVEKIYFDLQGNKIEKNFNELIIEQTGLRRKKVFIAE